MSTHAHDRYLNTVTFASLDGLRALCILAVVWHHTGGDFKWSIDLLNRGYIGVHLFFVISGFLIVTLLLREKSKNGEISLRNFYVRRTLRIFPIYYIVLGVLALATLFSRSSAALGAIRPELPFAFMYVSDFVEMKSLIAITWSLSAEEQFYLFWPAMERWFHGRVLLALYSVLLALNVAVQLGVGEALWNAVGWQWPKLHIVTVTFTPILLGVGLAHLLHNPHGFATVNRLLSHRAAPWLACLATVLLASTPQEDVPPLARLGIHLTMVLWLAACVVREDHGMANLLQLRPLIKVGALSYGIYLYHMFARHAATKALPAEYDFKGIGLFVVTVAIVVVMAEFSQRLIERPFLSLKSKLQRQNTVRVAS